ncbi:MAG: PHP domain-containing protein [Ilumatobacteraceae bacterium]
MTPLDAIDRALYFLDRSHESDFKTKAFVRAREVLRALPPEEIEERAAANRLTELDGIGSATARLVAEALTGEADLPYLQKLDAETRLVVSDAAAAYRVALKGDCHLHTRWSDGSAEVETMARTAQALGHEYLVVTDHSPRLTIAHGLNRDRLVQQLDEIDAVNERLDGITVLAGMEVDILEDGALDLDEDLLERLDLVVASVHSKLKMERSAMTQRMVLAVANPHVDVLGHCTGRHLPKRGPSDFDADYVFAACAKFGTAVEINCRPERLDPPQELLELALDYGCQVMMDTDAHAPGQLEWQVNGCEKAAEAGVPAEQILNTRDLAGLRSWLHTEPAQRLGA